MRTYVGPEPSGATYASSVYSVGSATPGVLVTYLARTPTLPPMKGPAGRGYFLSNKTGTFRYTTGATQRLAFKRGGRCIALYRDAKGRKVKGNVQLSVFAKDGKTKKLQWRFSTYGGVIHEEMFMVTEPGDTIEVSLVRPRPRGLKVSAINSIVHVDCEALERMK